MLKKLNKFSSFLIFLILVGFLVYRQSQINKALDTTSENQLDLQQTPTVSPAASLTFQVKDDKTSTQSALSYKFVATSSAQKALELVESQVKLDLKKYDFGIMVNGVNSLEADNKHYWAIYQNGEYAKTGLSEIVLDEGDQLELKYEEIKL